MEQNFRVSEPLTLTLEDLSAKVTVIAGARGIAYVEITGAEKLISQIKVSQPRKDQVCIKGKRSESSGNTIVQSFSGGSMSVTQRVSSVRGRMTGVTISDGNIIIGGKGKVIVNGKVVSGGDEEPAEELPTIQVAVPIGTNLEVYDVELLNAVGLGGKLDLSLSEQDQAKIDMVSGMKVRLSGQAKCQINHASGDVNAAGSGQTGLTISGNVQDVEATVSGQSNIVIRGNCHNIEATASGLSSITVGGTATGRVRQRASGQSSINI